jgi:hypothetical protein
VNVAECSNNFGFNLQNFTCQFIEMCFEDVREDYQKSFVGSFASQVFAREDPGVYICCVLFTASGQSYCLTQNRRGEREDLECNYQQLNEFIRVDNEF